MYESSVYPYNWIDADLTYIEDDTLLIGLIINNDNLTPVVIKLTQNDAGDFTDDIITPSLETAKKVFSIIKNNYVEPRICFITDSYAGGTYYLTEEVYKDKKSFTANSDVSYKTLYNTDKIHVVGRNLVSEKSVSPYLKVFYYPDFTEADTSLYAGVKHYFSNDGNYMIVKYTDNTYKIFNFHTIDNLNEFKYGFPQFVDFNNIKDFEFVGDFLLVFTSNTEEPLYFIALKNNYSRVENLSDTSSTYNISYTKHDLLGSKTLEGVEVAFTLTFGINKAD